VIPSIIATVFVYFFGGVVADKVSLRMTKWNSGRREPEHHLPNMAIPILSTVIGCFVFGYAAQNNLHYTILLFGSFLTLFGSLTMLTVSSVFVSNPRSSFWRYMLVSESNIVEDHRELSSMGRVRNPNHRQKHLLYSPDDEITNKMCYSPAIVNVSSLKIIISFFAASNVTTWLQDLGPLKLYSIFGVMLFVLGLGVPVLFVTGKRLRLWTAGKINSQEMRQERDVKDDSSIPSTAGRDA